ncbi:hypothetical protein D9756_000823 [Leucocoprinus leucothites]|uniref:WKF domain-containing protein n=1 Tax=Leucocoprinus leucothites TaxID=201217 RepID=A0A8H5GG84_9AGAR|nr:hypothetical protein D9756_000823 [Leucoagaricus leucothites]
MGEPGAAVEDKKSRKKHKRGKEKEEILEGVSTKKKGKDGQVGGLLQGDGTLNEIEGNGEEQRMRHKEKKKKKEQEQMQGDHIDVDSGPPEMEDSKGVERDKKKRKRDVQEDLAEPSVSIRTKRRSKKVLEVQRDEPPKPTDSKKANDEASNEKSKKERKKEERKKPSSESVTKAQTPAGNDRKRKRKHKNKTGFPDPEEDVDDESLSDQARKALSYAYIQFYEPDAWKFNKAKQNWLVRNFWSTKTIPEKYDGLVIKYLAGVQGNARENLIKTCREVINSADTPPKEGQESQGTSAKVNLGGTLIDTTSPTNLTETEKKTRAQALLQVLTPDSDT